MVAAPPPPPYLPLSFTVGRFFETVRGKGKTHRRRPKVSFLVAYVTFITVYIHT